MLIAIFWLYLSPLDKEFYMYKYMGKNVPILKLKYYSKFKSWTQLICWVVCWPSSLPSIQNDIILTPTQCKAYQTFGGHLVLKIKEKLLYKHINNHSAFKWPLPSYGFWNMISFNIKVEYFSLNLIVIFLEYMYQANKKDIIVSLFLNEHSCNFLLKHWQ